MLCGQGIGPNWPDDETDEFVPERSNFESEAARRAAWEVHRERLLDEAPSHAKPWAARRYDSDR